MRVSITIFFPIILALLAFGFVSALPPLRSCALSTEHKKRRPSRHMSAQDFRIMLIITAVYAVFAFYKLGCMSAPESFYQFNGESVTVSIPEGAQVSEIRLYSGVAHGGYVFRFSTGEETEFEQGHADVLKWHFISLDKPVRAESLTIESDARQYLGELVLVGTDGSIIPAKCEQAPELTDEADTCPKSSTYLNSSYFDEIYHARTAWEHLNDVNPYEVSHPPLGKLILSLGILIFGMNPFGWRFMGTLVGVLMLPVMYVFLKRLFAYSSVAAAGTIVFASDFMHLTQTRIATIDSYGVFFILLMYLFMYMYIDEGKESGKARGYLALSGLFFGLGAASKWICIYAGAGLALIWLIHWIRAMKREGFGAFVLNALWCLVFFVTVPAIIYYLSYYFYGTARGWSGPGMLFSREYLDMVLSNQSFMLSYHQGVNASHPYSSRWYQWVLDIRPILYYLEYFPDGKRSSFAAFLNPALCWGGLLCLFALLYTALLRSDKRAGFILLGYLAQLVPWMFIERITFEYHYFPSSVFLVLSISYVMYLMRLNVRTWRVWVFGFAAVSVVLFVLFYPALTGLAVDGSTAGMLYGWLPTWPL